MHRPVSRKPQVGISNEPLRDPGAVQPRQSRRSIHMDHAPSYQDDEELTERVRGRASVWTLDESLTSFGAAIGQVLIGRTLCANRPAVFVLKRLCLDQACNIFNAKVDGGGFAS